MINLKNYRLGRDAARRALLTALEKFDEDKDNAALQSKVLALQEKYDKANDELYRAERRANWKRAERIIKLAAHGRGQRYAADFWADDFRVRH